VPVGRQVRHKKKGEAILRQLITEQIIIDLAVKKGFSEENLALKIYPSVICDVLNNDKNDFLLSDFESMLKDISYETRDFFETHYPYPEFTTETCSNELDFLDCDLSLLFEYLSHNDLFDFLMKSEEVEEYMENNGLSSERKMYTLSMFVTDKKILKNLYKRLEVKALDKNFIEDVVYMEQKMFKTKMVIDIILQSPEDFLLNKGISEELLAVFLAKEIEEAKQGKYLTQEEKDNVIIYFSEQPIKTVDADLFVISRLCLDPRYGAHYKKKLGDIRKTAYYKEQEQVYLDAYIKAIKGGIKDVLRHQ
jgi:hypothetical protein